MAAPRHPKKSETLEVRLPYQTKTAFMARCRRDGHTASEAVRDFIETQLVAGPRGPRRARPRLWQTVAAAVAGLVLGAVAAPSVARTVSTDQAAFDRLDLNRDGALSRAEYARR